MNRFIGLLLLAGTLLSSEHGRAQKPKLTPVPRPAPKLKPLAFKPTKMDMRMRVLMVKSLKVDVTHDHRRARERNFVLDGVNLSWKEQKPFIDSFYLASPKPDSGGWGTGENGIFDFEFAITRYEPDGIIGVAIILPLDNRAGKAIVYRNEKRTMYAVHPLTLDRWIHLLTDHPRVGAKFRERYNAQGTRLSFLPRAGSEVRAQGQR